MALGAAVPTTTTYVVVYNPSQYINTITNGQSSERIEALKHLLECITHSEIDLITLGSIWLCVTGLLTNEEQRGSINIETRLYALKCVLELIKIEQLKRRFFNLWLSFDFLARYKIIHDNDATLWLECFYTLTEDGKRIDLIDDRLRGRIFAQFINGILTGPMSRNNQAYNVLKDLLITNCHLRHDELSLLFESIFRHLNRDEDDSTANIHQALSQSAIRKSLDFLCWLIDHHTLDTALLHYFIQNVVDLHDKYKFSSGVNTELLQLITNHLAKAACHNTAVIGVLCGIITERLETPIDNGIDPLSTLLFVLTQTLMDIRQCLSTSQNHVQVSTNETIHRKCFLNTIRQLPLCWLTTLHRVLVKRQNVNIILINFEQFLLTIKVKSSTCALKVFDMVMWKMMDEIMRICHQYIVIDQKSTTTTRTKYEDCLTIFEDLANKLCCLPQRMVSQLFDIKHLTSITRTPRREQMIKESSMKLIRLLRPNNPEWSISLRELTEYIILNPNEVVTTRIDALTTVFDKYLWFKMTDQVTQMGQIILEALENLIHINSNSISEHEYLSKHDVMKQTAVQSIFAQFLCDHSIDSTVANHCYRILQEVYEEDCACITSTGSIHRHLMELILEQLCSLFETNLTYTRLTTLNHCSVILNFFLKQLRCNYKNMIAYMKPRIRLVIWQNLLRIRLRSSDSCLGMKSLDSDFIAYGTYRSDPDLKSSEQENVLDLRGYLSKLVSCLEQETSEVIETILGDLCSFLKQQSVVYMSNLPVDQLVTFLMELCHTNLMNKTFSVIPLQCLIICTSYKTQLLHHDQLIDCFLKTLNCTDSSWIMLGIQALTICLSNFHAEIQSSMSRILFALSKQSIEDNQISKMILEFLMHYLFSYHVSDSLRCEIFRILIHIIDQYQYQTPHNLLLAHTILCFFFNQLISNDRQLYSYSILRSLQPPSTTRDHDSAVVSERPPRLQRSGSLSSLNDDAHNNDMNKRKTTVLEVPGIPFSTVDENNPLKKLNDDLTRITVNFVNDHFYSTTLPQTVFICLPREVRRHHVNHSWLADDKILYQIKSYDFNQFNKAKEILANLMHEFDETMRNRHRRYTDGNKQFLSKNKDQSMLTTCQDDLHIRSLETDTNRSIFNERNLWIAVTKRTTTSTKAFLAINLSASPGMVESKNHQFHWFEGIQLSDLGIDCKSLLMRNENYLQENRNEYSINESALICDLKSIMTNLDRKEQENLLNRHNENYFPQRVHRVPSEARKSIESVDNVDPVRVAKIGVVYIYSGQEITETNILSNIRTSARYQQFMSSLAKLKSIKELQEENFYCPLLDANNPDNCGQYAYIWQNSIYQVLFHASTMMPNTRADHEFKKKLIGNDYVIIIYNENDCSFDMKTLKTGVCQYVIEVCPQMHSTYTRVRLKKRASTATSQNSSTNAGGDSKSLLDIDYVISDEHVASYVRILALCFSQQGELETRQRSSSSTSFLICSWQNRLQALRTLHTRCFLSYKN